MKIYKRITELGLIAYRHYNVGDFVKASDLEALLVKAVEVKSWGSQKAWSTYDQPEQTVQAVSGLVINIKPIEKPNPVNKAEIIEFIKAFVASIQSTKYKCSLDEEIAVSKDLISRIEQSGVSDE